MSFRMTCAECDDRLLEYAGDRVDPGERERIQRHLSACARCREQLAMWQTVAWAMDQEDAAIPPDVHAADGWAWLAVRLPQRGGQLTMNSSQSAAGGPSMARDTLRTVELDDDTGHHRELGIQLPPAGRPAHRWTRPLGAAAALILVALGATLFAALGIRPGAPSGGSTGVARLIKGIGLPPGVEVTAFAPTGADEGWATGATAGLLTDFISGVPDKSMVFHYGAGVLRQVGDALPSTYLYGLAMLSSTDGYALGYALGSDGRGNGVLLRIADGTLRRVPLPDVAGSQPRPILLRMRTADEGWLVVYDPRDDTGTYTSSILHLVNGVWTAVPLPLHYITDVAPGVAGEAWVIGATGVNDPGVVVHVNAGNAAVVVTPPTGWYLSGLRAFSPSDIWAQGTRHAPNGSDNVRDTPLLYHFDGRAWRVVDLRAPSGVQQVQIGAGGTAWATKSVSVPVPGHNDSTTAVIQAMYRSRAGRDPWEAIALPYADLYLLTIIPAGASDPSDDVWALGTYLVWTQSTPIAGGGSSDAGLGHDVLLHLANGEWTEYGR